MYQNNADSRSVVADAGMVSTLQPPGLDLASATPLQRNARARSQPVIQRNVGKVIGHGTINQEDAKLWEDLQKKANDGKPKGFFTHGTEVRMHQVNGKDQRIVYWYSKDGEPVIYVYGNVKNVDKAQYGWILKSMVDTTPQTAPKEPAKAKPSASGDVSKWRASGNLTGYPPVRSENPPNIAVKEDEDTYSSLRKIALNGKQTQKKRADSLLSASGEVTDYRYWFARVYQFVSEYELEFAKNTNFYYPSYVMRSVIYFEKIFEDNFNAYDMGGKVEDHWKQAFKAASKEFEKTKMFEHMMLRPSLNPHDDGSGAALNYLLQSVMGSVISLVQSMKAHIRFDLPRAETWVYNTYYKHMPGVKLEDFRDDFMAMSGVFDNAAAKMNDHMAGKLGVPVHKMPSLLQDTSMRNFFDADMAAERADTWRRAELLNKEGKSSSDPYRIEGGAVTGNVTSANHLSGLQSISDTTLRPEMEKSAELDDDDVRKKINSLSDLGVGSLPATVRIRMLRALFKGGTFNDDEDAMLKILNASKNDPALTSIVDGAGAWDMMYALDFKQATQLRTFLKKHYYAKTTFKTAAALMVKCLKGETAEWEEEMVVDILKARSDKKALIDNARPWRLLYNMTLEEYDEARSILRSHYYGIITKDYAVALIEYCMSGETAEWEERMIIDILLAHSGAYEIIRRIGRSKEGATGDSEEDYKNGLNALEWQLDGEEETLLDDNFGDY